MTKIHERALPVPWTPGAHLDAACDWAIAQMPCPAFRCDAHGAVASYNSAAERLWGGPPLAGPGRWGGFVALWRCDGTPVESVNCPAALAAAGARILPTELLAETMDGQPRRVVFHARSVLDANGRTAGSMCALTDVSERRRLEQDAQAASEERDLFLTMLGHELRNPLSPIMSAAASLRRLSSDQAVVRLADVVERQAKQLGRFIADLLATSRLRGATRMPIVIRDSTVGEVLDRAIDIATAISAVRDQTLTVDVGDRSAALRCDPERLAQALGNALLNASEYSSDGAQIRVGAVIANEIFQARVSDDGAGIEPGRLAEIFEPFKSFGGAIRKNSFAAGMGLWVAKNIAEAHGGVVFARSGGLGTGTTVVFALPIANSDAQRAANTVPSQSTVN